MQHQSLSNAQTASSQEKLFRDIINNDPILCIFLETGTMRPKVRFLNEVHYHDNAFVSYISPSFAAAYVTGILNAFKHKDIALIRDINANLLLLDPDHKLTAFNKILQFLEEKRKTVISYNSQLQQGQSITTAQLEGYTDIMTISIMNYLPQEFNLYRTEYCLAVVALTKTMANTDRQGALTIVSNVRHLLCETMAANDAESFYRFLDTATRDGEQIPTAVKGEYPNGSVDTKVWVIVGGVILYLLKVLFLSSR